MESRWLLLGTGLLFGTLTLGFTYQGNVVQALIAAVFTTFGLGGFWWNSTRDEPIEPMFSQSR